MFKKIVGIGLLCSFFGFGAEYYVCYEESYQVPISDRDVLIGYDGCSISKVECSCAGQRGYGEYRRECDAVNGLKQCRKLQKKF